MAMRALDAKLFISAYQGELAAVVAALAAGAVVDVENKQGATPLFVASFHGHATVVDKLLAAGADINHAMHDGATPVYAASQEGQLMVLDKLIVAGADVNSAMDHGGTPLSVAAENGLTAIVERLLAAGADVNLAMNNGTTPLSEAAENGHTAIVERLLAAGADVNLAMNNGTTPLSEAAEKGHAAIVQRLLDHGADVGSVDERGNSALHCAAVEGHDDVARILLDAGADPAMRNKQGKTAADRYELMRPKKDAGWLRKNTPSVSPFFRAIERGRIDVVRRLASAPGVLNTVDARGLTPLHYAVKSQGQVTSFSKPKSLVATSREDDRLEVLRFLLATDSVDVNAPNFKGESPLFLASQQGDLQAIRLLLDHGARADQTDNAGRTPLSVAASPDSRSILQVYFNSQQFHDRSFDLLNNKENPPSSQRISELVPLITSVFDLRMIFTLASLSAEPTSQAVVIKPALDHVVSNKLTFDDDACVFFKLVLERCERNNLISREDFLLLDRKAEKANTESADWVVEMKRQVHTNSWRLDAHEHHLRSVVDGVKHLHAMVLENRAAVVATAGRVEQLQTQIVAGKKLLGKLMIHAKHTSTQVTHLQNRLEQTDDNIRHVAKHLTNFRDAYLNRIEQEKKNQRTKRICGAVASVAGFIIGPVLKEISDAVVDYANPIDIVSTIYGERDIAGFLAEQSDKALPEIIKNQLEKYAISEEEFETLLREEIALQHPEIVAECEERGLAIHVDGGRSEAVGAVVESSLEAEEAKVVDLLQNLHAALREGASKQDGMEEAERHMRAEAPSTVAIHPRTSLDSSTQRSLEATTHEETITSDDSDGVVEPIHVAADSSPSLVATAASSVKDITEPDSSDASPRVEPESKEFAVLRTNKPDITESASPTLSAYHAAVEKSCGDVSSFRALISTIDTEDAADATTVAPVQLRTTRASREKLCAAEYAYARGDSAVGDFLASKMPSPPQFDTSDVVSVKLAEPTDAFAYVCIVDECRGDVEECALLCEVVEGDDYALDAAIEADVEREVNETFVWTPLEYACHLGYVEIVKFMLKELCKNMPPKQKIDLMRRVRDRDQAAAGAAA